MNKMYGELTLMSQVQHPNIVQCKGVCFLANQTLPVLLMERLTISLHAYLLDPTRSNKTLEKKVSILYDVARGLFYLHSRTRAIIHRDLTGKNVLLESELRAKIADFGNTQILDLDPESTPETFTSLLEITCLLRLKEVLQNMIPALMCSHLDTCRFSPSSSPLYIPSFLQPMLMIKGCMLVQRLKDVSSTWTKLNNFWERNIL